MGPAACKARMPPDGEHRGDACAGVGHTIRRSVESQHGLLEDAEAMSGWQDNESCCGVENHAYSLLARLPAVHTYGTLAFFVYFGHYWLLMQRPDVAVGIVACFMLYGMVRFWVLWGGVPWAEST